MKRKRELEQGREKIGRRLHLEEKVSLILWGCLQLLVEMEEEMAMGGGGDKVGSSGSRCISWHIYIRFSNEYGSC